MKGGVLCRLSRAEMVTGQAGTPGPDAPRSRPGVEGVRPSRPLLCRRMCRMDASGRSYSLLQDTSAICRMDKNAPLPDWVAGGEFWSISRTPDELSIVCPQGSVPADVDHEAGWKCLKVDSPFEFDLAGMISFMAAPLAEAEMDLFVVATQDSDYLMVREKDLERATAELAQADSSLDP